MRVPHVLNFPCADKCRADNRRMDSEPKPNWPEEILELVAMTRAVFAITVALLYGTTAAAPQPPVTFESAFGTRDATPFLYGLPCCFRY